MRTEVLHFVCDGDKDAEVFEYNVAEQSRK